MSVERSELQIRTLLGEVAQLSQRDVPPEEFHAEFLRRVVTALGAIGGGLWILEKNALTLSYQINLKELHLKDGDTEKHTRLLQQLLQSPDTATLLPPYSGTEGDNESGNPTEHLLILCSIRTELESVGLVEIIHHPHVPPAVQQSFVQFLVQACRFATDYYKNRQLRHFGERQNLWTVLEDFTRSLHQSLDPTLTAYTVVNEGRRLIGCDRVSVALRSGNACPITAVSGQDTINKRSTTVQLLGKLATAAVKAGEPIWYTGSTSDFPPQIENIIEKYVDESHTKMIAVTPLFHRKKEHDEEQQEKRRRQRLSPFGALIVEQIEDSQLTEQTRKRIDIVAEHAGSALGNALEHHSIFLLPVWKLLGKSKKLVAGETLPKTLAVTAVILAVVATLLFMPYKFQMHCTGTVEPIHRHRIYSPLDAKIKELFVDHGTQVLGPLVDDEGIHWTGSKLLELQSSELETLGEQLYGEYKKITEELISLDRMLLDQNRRDDYERAQLVGEKAKATIQLETVQKKLAIFEQYQKPELYITSPMNGVVISWDVRRRLVENRPISRMQYVMEIADLEGPWHLELLMPEKKMGYIVEQQNRQPDAPLRVEFVLATKPDQKIYGLVTEIHDRAEVRSGSDNVGTAANTVSIKVAIDDLESLRSELYPGAECSARIDCGKRSLGYVLFYELIVYVQKNILFRWF